MVFDFDREIDRLGTQCVKWEFVDGADAPFDDHQHPRHGRRLLPLWVADMDFLSPPAVIAALRERAEHGIFGYSAPADSYYEAVTGWMTRRHGWAVDPSWIHITPGVVTALYMLVKTFTSPGDKILVQRPVYYPFFRAITDNGCVIVSNTLLYEDGYYRMDFKALERQAADPAVKLAILCSPHNPVGRVWTLDELRRFGEICVQNNVIIIADEIHGDLIYEGHRFVPFVTTHNDFRQATVTCTAASKSFNLAGLKTSNIIIANQQWSARFASTLEKHAIHGANPFGLVATEAAYNAGESWLAAVMAYVEDNYRFMNAYIARHLPQLRVIRPQGTYLVWVDCRELGLEPAARKELLLHEARVCLDEGALFGPEGEDFERFNVACPRSILQEALERIATAVADQKGS